jgi:hypothetical protein
MLKALQGHGKNFFNMAPYNIYITRTIIYTSVCSSFLNMDVYHSYIPYVNMAPYAPCIYRTSIWHLIYYIYHSYNIYLQTYAPPTQYGCISLVYTVRQIWRPKNQHGSSYIIYILYIYISSNIYLTHTILASPTQRASKRDPTKT